MTLLEVMRALGVVVAEMIAVAVFGFGLVWVWACFCDLVLAIRDRLWGRR